MYKKRIYIKDIERQRYGENIYRKDILKDIFGEFIEGERDRERGGRRRRETLETLIANST